MLTGQELKYIPEWAGSVKAGTRISERPIHWRADSGPLKYICLQGRSKSTYLSRLELSKLGLESVRDLSTGGPIVVRFNMLTGQEQKYIPEWAGSVKAGTRISERPIHWRADSGPL